MVVCSSFVIPNNKNSQEESKVLQKKATRQQITVQIYEDDKVKY
jgi:hypothetical protein